MLPNVASAYQQAVQKHAIILSSCATIGNQAHGTWYRKFPKYLDTQNFFVFTLKFELCGSTIE